jgi:HPt (histidine-containing phosphotransfer) domain-containing protein
MDGSMPEMDGLTATRHIRNHEVDTHSPPMPIVGLTAQVVGVDARQWLEAGMDAVVHKPFTIPELARTIERFLPQLVSKETCLSNSGALEEKTHGRTMGGATELFDNEVFSQLVDMDSAGQRNLVERIVGLYTENAPLALAQIEDAAANDDAAGCARAAHSLKSMSFSIGASSVARHAHDIEAQCRCGGALKGGAGIESLKQVVSDTMREISFRMSGPAWPVQRAS